MMDVSIFIVDPSDETRMRLANGLDEDIQWLGHDSIADLAQAIDAGLVPAVAILGPAVDHQDAMTLSQSIQAEQLPVGLVQVTKKLDPERLREALRVGIVDVVEDEVEVSQLAEAVGRARAEAVRTVPRPVDDRDAIETGLDAGVVAVVAGKRGVGSSLLCTNLAVALAEQGHETALVDLDLRGGDLAIMLQHRPSQTILDAVSRIDHLDTNAIDGYLAKVGGVRLLAAPMEGEDHVVDADLFDRILGLVAAHVDIIVVDVGDSWSPMAHHMMTSADLVVVVSTMEVPAVRGTRRVLAQMSHDGVPFERVLLVANQADAPTGLSAGDIAKSLDTDFDVRIPADKHASRSINEGDPLVHRRRSKAAKAIQELATHVTAHLELG